MSKSTTKRRSAAFVALAGMLLAAVAPGLVAQAAEIPNVIQSVTTNVPDGGGYREGGPIESQFQWCIPDGTRTGDAFTLTIPKEIGYGTPASFPIDDPTGAPVATVTRTTDTPPQVYTVTFVDGYPESHLNTCGEAKFSGRLASGSSNGTTPVDLTYVSNDGRQFVSSQVIAPAPIDPWVGVKKNGFFTDPNDEGRTVATDALSFSFTTPNGPTGAWSPCRT